MTTVEPKRTYFQAAIYSFFALYLGVTPPAPGKEGFYAGLLITVALFLLVGGYLLVRYLFTQMLG